MTWPRLRQFPAGTELVLPENLRRGDLVSHRGRLCRVVSVEEQGGAEPHQWQERSWVVILRPWKLTLEWTAMSADTHWRCHYFFRFYRYSESTEHVPVCSQCGGPWPCPQLHIEQQVREEAAEAEQFAVPPGVCPACQEPVTQRQLRQEWPINLYALDREQPVTFHLRRQCEAAALRYDRAMIAAGYKSRLGIRS